MLSIAVEPGERFVYQKPRVLFSRRLHHFGGPGILNYDLSADGQRFLMIEEITGAEPVVHVVQGFERRVRQGQQ